MVLVERLTQLLRLLGPRVPELIERRVLERIHVLVTERYHMEREHTKVVFSKYMQALCDLLLATMHSLRSSPQDLSLAEMDWRTLARVERGAF